MSNLVKKQSAEVTKLSPAQLEKADSSRVKIIEESLFLSTLHNHAQGLTAFSFVGGIFGGAIGAIATLMLLGTGELEGAAAASALTVSGGYFLGKVHFMTDAISWPTITKTDALGSRLLRRSVRKRGEKLDRRYGWRPRQGVMHPRGRTDTYDRYLLDVTSSPQGLYNMQITVWTYSPVFGWTKGLAAALPNADAEERSSSSVVYDVEEEEEMLEHYGRLSEAAIALNNKSESSWEQHQVTRDVRTEQIIAAQLNASNPGVH